MSAASSSNGRFVLYAGLHSLVMRGHSGDSRLFSDRPSAQEEVGSDHSRCGECPMKANTLAHMQFVAATGDGNCEERT